MCKRRALDPQGNRNVPIFNDGDDEEFLARIMRFEILTTAFPHMLSASEIRKTAEAFMECFDSSAFNNILRR